MLDIANKIMIKKSMSIVFIKLNNYLEKDIDLIIIQKKV